MAGVRRPTEWRVRTGEHGRLRAGPAPSQGPRRGRRRGNADDRLLAPLRRHRGWTLLGLIVAVLAAGTRFVAIGILPPSIKMKPFAHAEASTQVVVGTTWASSDDGKRHSAVQNDLSTRSYTLADMVDSPEITDYVARAAGLPASKIGTLGPLWVELWRAQQWASGAKRSAQIVIEKDPYQITISEETDPPAAGPGPGPGPPVIDVQTQAPTTGAAARLASAVPAGLSAYVQHLQAADGFPERDRLTVRQLVPVSVTPARTSQLATVGVFTLLAVFVLWCGAEIAVSSLTRDLRGAAAASKAGDVSDRSSSNGPLVGDPA